MSIVRLMSRAACAAVFVSAAACGGASSPTTPASPTTPTPPAPAPPVATTTVNYSGVFANGMFTGGLTLSAVVPVSMTANTTNGPLAVVSATGTAKFSGANTTPVSLSGTYDTTTGKFTLTSAGWMIDATVAANGVVSGTISTPAGAGSVTAQVTTQADPVVNYCGSYTGSEGGKFLVTIRAGLASGVAAQNGVAGGILLAGSVNGNSVTLTWSWVDDGVGSGRAVGTINGNIISGTWENTEGNSGTWSGTAGC